MYHFFVTPDAVAEGRIFLEGGDVNHMKNVLRMRPGEQVEISDGNNRMYRCAVERYEEGKAVLAILESRMADTELASRITLFQGLPKADKMDWIVQKAVELGAARVVPLAARRSVVKLDEKKSEKKVSRWNSISESAAKQAGRAAVPEVTRVMGWKEALELAETLDVLLIPYELERDMEHTRTCLERIKPGQSIGMFIGPEGGFEKEEVEAAQRAGAESISLGRRILRTETAGLALLSVLMFRLEQ
ncbi:16S rRNA (uracil(1498)-N(3))-methyltransferase [Candidatus Bariatricus faecipullorum]